MACCCSSDCVASFLERFYLKHLMMLILSSLVPRPHLSRGKRSGEPSQISWAYYRNVVRTNEIAILSIIYYVAHSLLTSCDARSRKIVFQFQLLTWEQYVVATTSEATSYARGWRGVCFQFKYLKKSHCTTSNFGLSV